MQEQSSSKLYCFIISCFWRPGAGNRDPYCWATGGREPGALLFGRPEARYWLKARVAAMQVNTPMSQGHLTFSPRIIAIAHTIAP